MATYSEVLKLLNIPFYTTAANTNILGDAGLITTEFFLGRESQKMSSKRYDIIVSYLEEKESVDENELIVAILKSSVILVT